LQYSTDSGERESRPFHEEPETHLLVLHLDILHGFIMHSALPACPQPLLVRSLQLVEVRPYGEEKEIEDVCNRMQNILNETKTVTEKQM